jgi:hypothetical protein
MSINAMQLTKRGLEPCGRALVGALIMNQGKVVRASQLIASVRPTRRESGGARIWL